MVAARAVWLTLLGLLTYSACGLAQDHQGAQVEKAESEFSVPVFGSADSGTSCISTCGIP